MIHLQSNITKQKFKHLEVHHYQFIESEYNHFISSGRKCKTDFMKSLAIKVGTSLSNLYTIISDGMITILSSDLVTRNEFNANTAFEKRVTNLPNNSSKLDKAADFIEDVVTRFKCDNNLDSIDEIIQHKRLFKRSEYTCKVSTSTFYNYIHNKSISIKPIDCPMITRRRRKRPLRVSKRHKGTSISKRPESVESREEFGHWKGDTVVRKNGINDRSLLTLVERKTRYQIVVPLMSQTSKQVYMAFNKLEKSIGIKQFKEIFK